MVELASWHWVVACDEKPPCPPCRFYGILNQLGLYNKNAKILFLVGPACLADGGAPIAHELP